MRSLFWVRSRSSVWAVSGSSQKSGAPLRWSSSAMRSVLRGASKIPPELEESTAQLGEALLDFGDAGGGGHGVLRGGLGPEG